MNITYHKNIIRTVSTIEDLVEDITNKNFKQLTPLVESRIIDIIEGADLTKTEYQKAIKGLFKYEKGQSFFSKTFWTIRGWPDNEATQKVHDIQLKNSKKFTAKVESGEISHNWSR